MLILVSRQGEGLFAKLLRSYSVERLCSVPVFSIVTYSVFRGEMGAAEDGDLSANQRPTWASINQSEASMV